MEEIVILDEQKRRHPLADVTQVLGLEELREMTVDTISVDDFDPEELRSAGYRPAQHDNRAAA